MRLRIGVLCATLVACESVDPIDDGLTGMSIGVDGGFVTSEDGAFTVVFPPGALSETMVITVRFANDVPPSLGLAYAVQGMSTIAKPIFVEYRYTIAQVEGQDRDELNIGREAPDRWEPLVRLEHNEHTQTVSASDASVATAYGLILGGIPHGDESGSSGADSDGGETHESTTGHETTTGDPTMGPASTSSSTGNDTGEAGCGDGEPEPGELCLEPAVALVGGGLGPIAVAAADLDGDGHDDLVVAHAGSSDVSVRLGDGAGGFADETLTAVATAPADIAIADFDGDGLDVVTAGASVVSLLLGDGAGGLADELALPVANGSAALATGDFDEDGAPDLVVAHTGAAQIGLLLGAATGLAVELPFPAAAAPLDVAVGDFNGDANLDVLTAGGAGVGVQSGNGAALLGSPFSTPLPSTVTAIVVGDWNGDALLDVAALDTAAAQVLVSFGNGLGGLAGGTPYPVGLAPAAVVAGDLDRDGIDDLAIACSGDDTIAILVGDAGGSFEPARSFSVGASPIALALADWNDDDAIDIAIAQNGDDGVGLLLSHP